MPPVPVGFIHPLTSAFPGSLTTRSSFGAPQVEAASQGAWGPRSSADKALESGPMYFKSIMELVGSEDGREIAVELNELRRTGELSRLSDGQYLLGAAERGRTGLPEGAGDDPNAGLQFQRN